MGFVEGKRLKQSSESVGILVCKSLAANLYGKAAAKPHLLLLHIITGPLLFASSPSGVELRYNWCEGDTLW